MRDEKALMWRDKEMLVSWQFAAAITLLMSLRGHAFKQVSQVFISPQLSFQLWADLRLCHISTEMKCSLRKRSCWENTGSQAYQKSGVGFLSSQALQFCSFFKTVLPKQLKSQSKWCHWSSALKSDFQNNLFGDIWYLGDRAARCWVAPSEEGPSDKFSKSCHQTSKKCTSNSISPDHNLQRIWKAVASYSHMDGNWPFEAFWLKRCSGREILGLHLFQRK